MKRRVLIGLAALVVVASGLTAYRLSASKNPSSTEADGEQQNSSIRLVAAGDMLPHETVHERAKSGQGYDYRQFFSEVEPFFQSSDIRFCNQETPSAGQRFGISGYPTFNAPTEFARDLSATGCNLISLANNHVNDKGQPGIDATVETWQRFDPLAVAGANRSAEEQKEVRYFSLKGVKFAFVAYAEYSNDTNLTKYGLNLLNEALVSRQLGEARQKADIVIVSAHWGDEFATAVSEQQHKWAKLFADNGADIVLGHGPHVLQPFQRLAKAGGGETVVWFSLGNMLSTQLETEALIGGLAVMDIDVASKEISVIGFLPTYMHYEWTAKEKTEEDLLARQNLKIYPLDRSEQALQRSLLGTTAAEQTSRIESVLSRHAPVKIISSGDY